MIFDTNNISSVSIPKRALQILLYREPIVLRVYLYGLINGSASIEEMAKDLGTGDGSVLSAIETLREDGFITEDIGTNRLIYNSVADNEETLDINVYTDESFNSTLERIFGDRVLNRKELDTFYRLVDTYGMSKDVVCVLAEYCVKLYGNKVSDKRITKTAEIWKDEGIDTREKANKRLASYSRYYSNVKELLEMLGLRRAPTDPELGLYEKWVDVWGFTNSGIKKAVDATTGASNPSLKYLDGILKNLYAEGKLSAKEIEDYFVLNEKLDDNIKQVLRELSYSNLTVTNAQRERYLSFINAGFTQDEILLACRQGAGKSRLDLEYVSTVLDSWKEKGLINKEDIQKYLDDEEKVRGKVGEVYKIIGKSGPVSKTDVNLYLTFRNELDFYDDVILYAAECARGYSNPMRSMNTILKNLKNEGIKNLDQAKEYNSKKKNNQKNDRSAIIEHDYSKIDDSKKDPWSKYKQEDKGKQ